MRTIHRIIRRTEIDVEFSEGFNPHMIVSIAQPLAVGMYSTGDYMDIELKEDIDESKLLTLLNAHTTIGVTFLEVVKVYKIQGKKVIKSMAAIDAAKYTIRFELDNCEDATLKIESLIERDKWEILKTTKKREKLVDIKNYIKTFNFSQEGDNLFLNVLISCGSRENLSCKLLSEFIIKNLESIKENSFVDIKREEMYVSHDDKYKTLSQYFKEEYGLK